jgi:hypothetical protein
MNGRPARSTTEGQRKLCALGNGLGRITVQSQETNRCKQQEGEIEQLSSGELLVLPLNKLERAETILVFRRFWTSSVSEQ